MIRLVCATILFIGIISGALFYDYKYSHILSPGHLAPSTDVSVVVVTPNPVTKPSPITKPSPKAPIPWEEQVERNREFDAAQNLQHLNDPDHGLTKAEPNRPSAMKQVKVPSQGEPSKRQHIEPLTIEGEGPSNCVANDTRCFQHATVIKFTKQLNAFIATWDNGGLIGEEFFSFVYDLFNSERPYDDDNVRLVSEVIQTTRNLVTAVMSERNQMEEQKAADAASRNDSYIKNVGLSNPILDGRIYFMIPNVYHGINIDSRKTKSFLTVREWLGLVFDNRGIKQVTGISRQTDGASGVSIKIEGEPSNTFLFNLDGGDIFITYCGEGASLQDCTSFTAQTRVESLMRTYAEILQSAIAPAPVPSPKPTVAIPPPNVKLTDNEIGRAVDQVARCWNINAGMRDAHNMVIKIRVSIDPGGNVTKAEIVDQVRANTDPVFREAAESARRALFNPNCTPLKLPPEKYAAWKDMVIEFKPKDIQ